MRLLGSSFQYHHRPPHSRLRCVDLLHSTMDREDSGNDTKWYLGSVVIKTLVENGLHTKDDALYILEALGCSDDVYVRLWDQIHVLEVVYAGVNHHARTRSERLTSQRRHAWIEPTLRT